MTLEPLEPDFTQGQTGLGKLDTCPRSFYLYRTVPASSWPMRRGTVFHDTVAEATLNAIEFGEAMPSELVKAILVEKLIESPLPWPEDDAAHWMTYHWAQAWDVAPEAIVGVELPLTVELGAYTLRGRLDLVFKHHAERTVEIRDYKTSFAIPDQAEFEASWQPWFYGMLLMFGRTENGDCLGDGLEWVSAREQYPRFLREDGTLGDRWVLRSRTQLLEFRLHVERLLALLDREWEAQEWPAIPGTHCGECPCAALCPIPAEERNHAGTINTLEQAQDAAEWVEVTGDRVAAVKKELSIWSRHHGPVAYGTDLELAHVMQESRALRRKGSHADWDGLQQAVVEAAEYGKPFQVEEFVQTRTSMAFKRRRREEPVA
jgi:RecB family exonuclease